MSAKIIQNDFAAKEVKYQERCLTKYQTEAQSIFHSKNRKILNDASSKHSKIYYQWRKEGEHMLPHVLKVVCLKWFFISRVTNNKMSKVSIFEALRFLGFSMIKQIVFRKVFIFHVFNFHLCSSIYQKCYSCRKWRKLRKPLTPVFYSTPFPPKFGQIMFSPQ